MSEQPPQQPGQPPYGDQPGWAPPPGSYPPGGYIAPPPATSSATTALVLGIVGIVACPLTSIPAIFVGRNATREIDESQGRLGGRSSAQAGYILGIIGTVLWALVILAVVAMFAFSAFLFDQLEDCFTESGFDTSGSSYSISC